MKKVATLTLYSQTNYGAILQTFALWQYLTQQGFDAKVLNYHQSRGYDSRSRIRKIISYVWQKGLRPFLKDKVRLINTEKFRRQYTLTDRYYTPKQLNAERTSHDYYIVGSDQVWNPTYAGRDSSWFLSFTSKKKFAYAASFGLATLPEEYNNLYRQFIQQLDAVSVREESAARLIQAMGLAKPPVVLDPVFLLSREQWHELAVKPIHKKYILCYYMPGFPPVEKTMAHLAQAYAQKYHCPVLNIGKKEYSRFFFWENNLRGVGPAEFLGLIEHAELVITNSFHATAFSVLFDKKFISVINTSLGKKDLSSRMVDLLTDIKHKTSLLDISKNKEAAQNLSLSKESKEILEQKIVESKQFLFNQLGDSNA